MNFLCSDSDTDGSINVVSITDQGSHLRTATVEIAGVPATSLVDTGADITIMGPEVFKKVAAVAGLKKRQFKPADKQPHTYDRRQFKLDGRLDLDISFNDKMMHTPVYEVLLISNPTGTTHKVSKGTCVGVASEAEPVESLANSQPHKVSKGATEESQGIFATNVYSVETIDLEARKQKLLQSVAEIGVNLPQQDKNKLFSLLYEYHDVFILEEGERGETANED